MKQPETLPDHSHLQVISYFCRSLRKSLDRVEAALQSRDKAQLDMLETKLGFMADVLAEAQTTKRAYDAWLWEQ